MLLASLKLQQFRNHTKRSFEFSKTTTAIIGHNAVGKSNILEAVYLLATGKSGRAEKDEELIEFDQTDARIEGMVEAEHEINLAIAVIQSPLGKTGKAFFVNGVRKRRMDFVGNLAAVLFTPEDIDLIIDSPALRRDYIDTVLSQVDKDYRVRLSRYDHALKRRNKLLWFVRERQARAADLDIWDKLLVESGQKLTEARQGFFAELNMLNPEFPDIHWDYVPKEISQEKLDTNRARDIDAAQTLSGPHRDDFAFFNGKRNLEQYGSRGEQRIGVLALKMAELSFIASRINQRPILLLDDIFSELDEEHRETVISLLGKQQTILTSTEEEYVLHHQKDVTVIRL